MRRMSRLVSIVLLAAFASALFAGCAVQSTAGDDGEQQDDPRLIRNELEGITMDIENREEELKSYMVEQQMEDGAEIRDAIRSIEMDLYGLRGRKAALEQRLAELQAAGQV